MTRTADPSNGPTAEVIALSHRFGGDPAFVLAGGGNTSSKTAETLWVKASGHALATIDAGGFVALQRDQLDAMLAATWPDNADEREALFLSRVMNARLQPERGQRPSVEALLHHLLPDALVVHTHPGLVNAVTCCVDGERLTREWFGQDVLWQPYVDPGVTLAQALRDSLARRDVRPAAVFLENHGLIVAGGSASEIEAVTNRIVERIADERSRTPNAPDATGDAVRLKAVAERIGTARSGLSFATDAGSAAAWMAGTKDGLAAVAAGPLTPDQIVYCRSFPLRLKADCDDREIATAWAAYEQTYGIEPWVAVVEGAGLIAMRTTPAMAATTLAVYVDAAGVSRDASSLGGVRALSAPNRQFIEQWEVEAYRRSIAAKASS